ncbi:capsule assembly Wzi family protein [Christiangramia sabulilitoris]|uniref:Capsule assembly Wzi family protein n=1 Tax=Christiangramia sabulilitoris TaxID=2583991 RepID=A0A550I2A9_9FLAO|nr:capsule assembly Wzi family protein [Christiangramia sabulilitoris]TRO65091.1 capsule assembly Wzi family protein [Christiangramia sabulilitoris]
MRIPFIVFFVFVSVFQCQSQTDFNINLEGIGLLYSGEESPLWLHSNRRGRVDEESNLSGLISATSRFNLSSDTYAEFGVGGLYKDGFTNGIRIDEAYFNFVTPKIGVVVGKMQREDIFQGLSASNENILWSLNAGPMPGIRLYSRDPIFLFKDRGIGFKVSLEEYLMDDNRYIQDTRVHHKSLHAVYRGVAGFQIEIGAQHFVQWAGVSEEFGQLPKSFEDYLRIFTGMASEGDVGNGQEVNALGNQIGSYEIKVKTKIRDLDFKFLYNHIFEDASGLKGGNLPDGRYGIYVEDNRDDFWGTSILKAFMYEFYYTKNQSRDRAGSLVDGADNYFNNNLYRSGWTYNSQILGVPFILLNDNNFRIGTNIIMVHHLGLKGELIKDHPYRFLLSYRKNYGVKDSFFPETRNILSTLLEMQILDGDYNLKAQIGADIKSFEKSNYGFGINFSKTIF